MSDEICINDQLYRTVRLVAKSFSYSSDYLTRLAREKKIKAVQLSRRWYICVDSLQSYLEVQNQEQEIRQKLLKQTRLKERVAYEKLNTVSHKGSKNPKHVIATLGAVMLILLSGGFLGLWIQSENNMATVVDSGVLPMMAQENVVSEAGSDVLRVSFTDNGHTRVLIAGDRVVERPDRLDEGAWFFLEYE